MRPTTTQIAEAAYLRWERRGRAHGGDVEDWVAAERDLTFGLIYRYLVRIALNGPKRSIGAPEGSTARTCRFCERSAPAARFAFEPPLAPAWMAGAAVTIADECTECRGLADAQLAAPFEAFARPWVAGGVGPGLTPAAWKALVRVGLSLLPAAELHHVGDAVEWVANPNHVRDAGLFEGQGCHVYTTAEPLPAPFAAVAQRVEDEAPWPYLLAFLGAGRAVFQTHLPLCPRDEDLDSLDARGPVLSMSTGSGASLRSASCRFLPVETPASARRVAARA
jgi:hypothetical protein